MGAEASGRANDHVEHAGGKGEFAQSDHVQGGSDELAARRRQIDHPLAVVGVWGRPIEVRGRFEGPAALGGRGGHAQHVGQVAGKANVGPSAVIARSVVAAGSDHERPLLVGIVHCPESDRLGHVAS